ncbi:MAG: helix-turn-helix domain-containing protein [Fibrobacter sp.]|uniref:helix-turn-helix domain-containing protein n=1 Tax=Fibrobacter sp. TaxID=35828 RepID=UPI00388FC460|nr:helix-turn-helix domain-containing protein [Fibrobacter sp.]
MAYDIKTYQKAVGVYVMNYRHLRDMTQQELSRETGLSRQFISKMECGCQVPSIATLLIVADGLEITLDQFIGGVEKTYVQLQDVQSRSRRVFRDAAECREYNGYIALTKSRK